MRREHMLYYAIGLGILIAGLAWAGVPTSTILVGLLVLGCPLMMMFMMRGMHGGGDAPGGEHHEEPRDTAKRPGAGGRPR